MNTIPLQELKDWFHALPEDHKFEFSAKNEEWSCGCVLTQFGRSKGLKFEYASIAGVYLGEYEICVCNFFDGEDEFEYLADQIDQFLRLELLDDGKSAIPTITKKEILSYIPEFLK